MTIMVYAELVSRDYGGTNVQAARQASQARAGQRPLSAVCWRQGAQSHSASTSFVKPKPMMRATRQADLELSNMVSYHWPVAEPDDWLHSHRPWSPPIVQLAGDGIGHLLCWEKNERDGSWYAWVSWVQSTGDPVRHRHHVVSVRAETVQRLENPDAYARVPRRVLGTDGQIRPWSPAGPSTRHAAIPGTNRATITGPSAAPERHPC